MIIHFYIELFVSYLAVLLRSIVDTCIPSPVYYSLRTSLSLPIISNILLCERFRNQYSYLFLYSIRPATNDLSDTGKGVKRCRLDQTYAGYEVFGAGLEAETDMDGRVTGQYAGLLATNLEKDIPDPEACVREVKDMLDIAMADDGYTPPAEYVLAFK